jgi:uncharacterized protein
LTAAAATPDSLSTPLVDEAQIIRAEQLPGLISALDRLRAEEDIWLVVWTVPSLQGRSIEDVAFTQFGVWRIGEKGKDNGLLLVIARDDHKMRLEVGAGLEGDIPDIRARALLDAHLRPSLRAGNPVPGILGLIDGIKASRAAERRSNDVWQQRIAAVAPQIFDPDGLLDQGVFNALALRIEAFRGLGLACGSWPKTALERARQ